MLLKPAQVLHDKGMKTSMKAAQINTYGASDVVKVNNSTPLPTPSAGSILVEVHAAGVNPLDWKIREGYMQHMAPLQFPSTLGGDFSGVVTKVGEAVSLFQPGDEVYGQAIVIGDGSGSFAEYVAAKAESAAYKPKTVGHTEAAALPLTGVSALQALTEHMHLASGQKVLIHGGAGGIGTIAIQLAKHLGASVATTVRTEEQQYAKELGADVIIDYKNQRFEEVVHDYDAVFDTVGGGTYAKSFRVLKKGGILVSMLEQSDESLMKQYDVKAIAQFTQVTNGRLAQLTDLVDQGVVKVRIEKIFPLEQAAEALTYLQTGHPRGKVVVQVREFRA